MSKELTELLHEGGPAPVGPGMALTEILKDLGGKIWDGATPMAEHGAAELTSALLGSGHGHVPYGWSHASEGQDVQTPAQPDHRLAQQGMEGPEMDGPSR